MTSLSLSCYNGAVTPALSIPGKDIEEWRDKDADLPIVYAWKRNEIHLYIGISHIGFSRPFGGQHHIINKVEPVLETDTFEIYYTNKPEALESYLIHIHGTKYNVCHNTFRGRILLKSRIEGVIDFNSPRFRGANFNKDRYVRMLAEKEKMLSKQRAEREAKINRLREEAAKRAASY